MLLKYRAFNNLWTNHSGSYRYEAINVYEGQPLVVSKNSTNLEYPINVSHMFNPLTKAANAASSVRSCTLCRTPQLTEHALKRLSSVSNDLRHSVAEIPLDIPIWTWVCLTKFPRVRISGTGVSIIIIWWRHTQWVFWKARFRFSSGV